MEIIESLIRGKYADQSLCEDGIFIDSVIVAVIDGRVSTPSIILFIDVAGEDGYLMTGHM